MVAPPEQLEALPKGRETEPRAALETVTRNYATYFDTAAQLRRLQEWVRGLGK